MPRYIPSKAPIRVLNIPYYDMSALFRVCGPHIPRIRGENASVWIALDETIEFFNRVITGGLDPEAVELLTAEARTRAEIRGARQ